METPRVQPRPLAEVEREHAESQASSSPVSSATSRFGLVMGFHKNPLKHHVKELLEAIQANDYTKMQKLVNTTQDNLEWLGGHNRKHNMRNYLFVFYANLFRFYINNLISHHNNQPIDEVEARFMWTMLGSEPFRHDRSGLEATANTPGSKTHVDNTTYIKDLAKTIIEQMKTHYQRLKNGFMSERTRTQWKFYDTVNMESKVDFIEMSSNPGVHSAIKEQPIVPAKMQKIKSLIVQRRNLYDSYYTDLDNLLDSFLLGEIELLKFPRGAIAGHERNLRAMRIEHQKNIVRIAGRLGEINLELKTTEPRLKKFVDNPALKITDPGAGGGKSRKNRSKKRQTRRHR